MEYIEYIGKQVRKKNKPFKSGNLINTVKGIIEHPILKIESFTFEEDDSYVECRRCILTDGKEEIWNASKLY